MEQKIYKPIAPFNDHKNCKGHGNFMLDSTLETEADRLSVILALDNAIQSNEIDQEREEKK